MKEKERMLDKNDMTLKLENMSKKSMNKHQISRNELSKKKSLQEKGITLIALVVTIIILLILAGVTLNIALSDGGLFSKTQEAAEKYKQAQSDEEEMIRQIATQMYSEYVGKKVKLENFTGKSNCKVEKELTGYNSDQIFERNDSMIWRIWDFDGNTLRLIGDPTTTKLYLTGAKGYNNGVYALDYVCKELYSNEEQGVSATTLKRSDIQKISTYDYTNYKHEIDGSDGTSTSESNGNAQSTIQFGESKLYEFDEINCPALWKDNDRLWSYSYSDDSGKNGNDKECTKWETLEKYENNDGEASCKWNNPEDFKESFYRHEFTKEDFINEKYYNLLFKDSSGEVCDEFWIGGRFVHLVNDRIRFGIDGSEGKGGENKLGGYVVCDSKRR